MEQGLWLIISSILGILLSVIGYFLKRIYKLILELYEDVARQQELNRQNLEDHRKLFESLGQHQAIILNHEGRIIRLETRDYEKNI